MGKRVGLQAYTQATRLIGEKRCKKIWVNWAISAQNTNK